MIKKLVQISALKIYSLIVYYIIKLKNINIFHEKNYYSNFMFTRQNQVAQFTSRSCD